MKTITVKLFTFNELSDKAKERAREWWRSCDDEFPWQREFENTVKAIENSFDIEFENIGPYEYTPFWYDKNDYREAREMSFARAVAYINNNFDFKVLESAREYSGKIRRIGCALAKNRYTDNLLTGYCSDYVTHESYKKFIEYGRKYKNAKLSDFFDILARGLRDEIESEYDYMQTDEYIDDILTANEYEFMEDGEKW